MANSKVNNKANTYAANMNLSSGSKKAPKLPQALQNVIPDTSYSGNMSKLFSRRSNRLSTLLKRRHI